MLICFNDLNRNAARAHLKELIAISADVSPWGADELLYELPQKWLLSFTAHTDELIGYCILSNKFPRRTHIHQFMVRADMRGKNVGRAMLCEAIARTEQKRSLSLKVHKGNINAQRFYLNNGFGLDIEDGDYLWMLYKGNKVLG